MGLPAIIDLVDRALLLQDPPRRLPWLFVPNLLGEYLLEQSPRSFLDPVLIGGLAIVVAMVLLHAGVWLWLLLGVILALRLIIIIWRLIRRVYTDMALLKYGVILNVHVLRMHTCCNHDSSTARGAYLDCAIPVSRRRTNVGSVWIPNVAEAERLAQLRRLPAICLVRAPGIWRLIDHNNPKFRYELFRGE